MKSLIYLQSLGNLTLTLFLTIAVSLAICYTVFAIIDYCVIELAKKAEAKNKKPFDKK